MRHICFQWRTSYGLPKVSLHRLPNSVFKVRAMFSIAAAILDNEASFFEHLILYIDISVQKTSWSRQQPHFNLTTLWNWVNHVAHLDLSRAGAILCLSYSGWSQTALMYLQLNSRCFFTRLENMKSFRNIWANKKLYFMSFLIDHYVLCFPVAYFIKFLKNRENICNKSFKS
jgi:hypothetical protein